MAGAIYHPQNLRFLKYPYLTVQTIILTSYSYIKPNQCWISEIVTDVYVLKISHNPGQNLLRQNLKIQDVHDSVFQLQILSLTHQNQCWIWPSFFLEVQNFPKNIWGFWGRGVFSRKKRFSILPVGYGHSCKKYVFDICLYRARLDFAFYYFLALKFIENLHKL